MREQTAVRRIQAALPLLRKLVDRLVRAQELPCKYIGSDLELAENIVLILGGAKVPLFEEAQK